MWAAILLCCACAQLASSAIKSEKFYNLDDEITLGRRDPKILAAGGDGGVDNMISIKISNPNDKYYHSDPVEEVDVNGNTPSTPNQLLPISNEGKKRVNELSILLSRVHSMPIALLMQDDAEVLRTAGIYMDYIVRNPALQNNFWLMKYNASGVSGVIAQSALATPEEFRLLLGGSASRAETKQNLGAPSESAASFFSVLKATRTLPRGAAILLFTNARVEDEDLAQLAIKETQNKAIRIFVVWQGAFPTLREEYKLLQEAAAVTSGAFLIGNTERKSATDVDYVQVNGGANPVIVHLSGIRGAQRVRVPIENGVSAIHVSLSDSVSKARFRTPQGYLIDLLDITAVARFARDSYVVKTAGAPATFECELALGAATPATVGAWLLETDAPARRDYNIVVSVRHALTVHANLARGEQQTTGKRRLRLDIRGDYAKIDNVTLISAAGERLASQHLRISVNDRLKAQDDIEKFQPGGNVDVDVDELPKGQFYIQLHGKDATGNDFQRVSYYNPLDAHKIIEPTTIQLGEGSELAQIPGRLSNILYRVTNHRDNVIFLRFRARDQQAYLRNLSPLWAWINPQQTVIVTLQMISQGSDDTVTFTAGTLTGADRTEKKAIVRSQAANVQDTEAPHMWHKFTSNCQEVIFSKCEDYSWTMKVTAQDRETGLLLLQSSPEGLYFPHGYTSGTTGEVEGVLSGSCCQSNIVLTAIDLRNNRRSYEANAYWTALSSAAIAAIVISILLVCVIIGAIVYCCIWGSCKRKQKGSHDIAESSIRYRGPENSATTTRY